VSVAGDRPGVRRAWTVVGFLAAFYIISYVDRLIFALLIDPIKAELGVTDTQIGLLVGTSFALFYTLFGLPLSRVADRANRRNLIFFGALLWNGMTAASAFAEDFAMLLFLRIGVALGEAVLLPAAMSLIGDLFERERRSLPTSVFVGVGATGGAGALIVGAAGLQFVSQPWVAQLPLVGHLEPWRLTLLLLGGPGVLVALAWRLIAREPPRTGGPGGPQAPIGELFAHMGRVWGGYFGLFGAAAMIATLNLGVLAWYPTHLVRTYAMPASQAGYLFGLIGVVTTLVGGLAVPALADRLNRGGRNDGFIWAAAASVALLTPLLIMALTAPTAWLSLTLAGPAFLVMIGMGIMCTATVPMLPPAHLRGQVSAAYLLVANTVGLGAGPLIVAVLSDQVFPGADGLGRSLVAMVCLLAPLMLIVLFAMRGRFAAALDAAARHEAEVRAMPVADSPVVLEGHPVR